MKNMTLAQRLLFVNITLLSSIGIWLTGLDQVHWSVYLVPGALAFAAFSGYCVGLDIAKAILKMMGITGKEVQKV